MRIILILVLLIGVMVCKNRNDHFCEITLRVSDIDKSSKELNIVADVKLICR